MDVILHVGMHKTGSSAIQRAYRDYNDGTFSYVDLGFENHSIPLYTAFSRHYLTYHIGQQRLDASRNRGLAPRLPGPHSTRAP